MLRTRAIAALILTPVAAFTIYFGGWVYFSVIALLLMIGITEYVNMMRAHRWGLSTAIMMGGVLLYLLSGMDLPFLDPQVIIGLYLFLSLVHVIVLFERQGIGGKTASWLAMMGGFFLFGWIGRHIILLRQVEDGLQWTFAVVAIIWMSDTMAYLVGSRIGRHQMTPTLSPKKSVEGYVSGIVLGTAGAALFKLLFLDGLLWGEFLLLSIILTPLIPAGDLGFSLLKREAGLKDASQLIPGHGGILDRFDTLIWGMMISYYLLLYLI